MRPYWPLFNDVDAGEYFNLFDSYSLCGEPFQLNFAPFYSALLVPGGDLQALASSALVYDAFNDNPIHDTPGVGGGLNADDVEWRDKEPDERRLWFLSV